MKMDPFFTLVSKAEGISHAEFSNLSYVLIKT